MFQSGTKAMDLAAEEGHSAVLRYLISQGASVEGANVSGSHVYYKNRRSCSLTLFVWFAITAILHPFAYRNHIWPQGHCIATDFTKSER